MSDIEKVINYRIEEIQVDNTSNSNDYKSDLLYIVWAPKWKWFKPPRWKIFKWAYNENQTLFTGVYPISIESGEEIQCDELEFKLEFECTEYQPDIRRT